MTKLYLLSKSIHRVLLVVMTVLGVLMGVSGIVLKYPLVAKTLSIDLSLTRYLHNQLSPWFSIIFILMTLTGIVMYIFPLLRRK